MFSSTRVCLRVLADLNEIIRRMKRKVILTIAINQGLGVFPNNRTMDDLFFKPHELAARDHKEK